METKNVDYVTELIESLSNDNGELDESKIKEWLDFMFLIDSVSNYLRDYCNSRSISEEKMYKLIALAFMTQKWDDRTVGVEHSTGEILSGSSSVSQDQHKG
jgi:hypothetical protein